MIKITVPESLQGLFGKNRQNEIKAVQAEVERRLKEWNPKVMETNPNQ